MRVYASQPPTHPLLVRGVLATEERLQRALLWIDLEPVDIDHEQGHKQHGQGVGQECCPPQQMQRKSQVYGIAREAVDASAD